MPSSSRCSGSARSGSVATWAGESDALWSIAQIADFNGDGTADLLWRNSATGALRTHLLDGTGVIATAPALVAQEDIDWRVASAATAAAMQAPVRNDSAATANRTFFGGTTASPNYDVAVWEMNNRTADSHVIVGVSSANWKLKGTADFNSDAKSDAVWQHQTTGQLAMWELNGHQPIGTGLFATVDPALKLQGAGWFDWDRSADLLFLDTNTRETRL